MESIQSFVKVLKSEVHEENDRSITGMCLNKKQMTDNNLPWMTQSPDSYYK